MSLPDDVEDKDPYPLDCKGIGKQKGKLGLIELNRKGCVDRGQSRGRD